MCRAGRGREFRHTVIFKTEDDLSLLHKLRKRCLRLLSAALLKGERQRDDRNYNRSASPRDVGDERGTTASRATAETYAQEDEPCPFE